VCVCVCADLCEQVEQHTAVNGIERENGCVRERERASVCDCERESMCVCEREREIVGVFDCVCVCDRQTVCVCVCANLCEQVERHATLL